jgi:hypothetical protein
VTVPGDGPAKEQTRNDRFEYRAVATPDVKTPNPPRAYVRAYYEGGLYQCKCCHCLRVYLTLTVCSDGCAFRRGCNFDSEGWA